MHITSQHLSHQFMERLFAVGSIGALAVGAMVVYAFNPTTSRFYPLCPFYLTTGCYCPGCGVTRASHQLLSGDILAALSFNPMAILALPVLGYVYVSFLSRSLIGWRLPSIPTSRHLAKAVFIAVLLFTVARNIPVEPFTWLAP